MRWRTEENREKVRAVNTGGTQNIAWVCKELGCKLYGPTGRAKRRGSWTVRTMTR